MLDTIGVRTELEAVERALRLAETGGTLPAQVRVSFDRLVTALALGPAPELRLCPHCGSSGMRAAIRCGTCWAKLVPPEPAAAA